MAFPASAETLVARINTVDGPFEVVDMVYDGRPARVLFSGDKKAAQSGVARDDRSDLLFDYNQRFFELVASLQPRSVLLIGGGAMTLPMALRAADPALTITVVEINPDLPAIAERYFGFTPDARLQVVAAEGRQFLAADRQRYDLIIIDAFMNATMPHGLLTAEAAAAYAAHLSPRGVVAANCISAYYGHRSTPLYRLTAAFQQQFKQTAIFPASRSLMSFWLPQNFIVVGRERPRPALELRYAALEALRPLPDDLQHDRAA